jgi:hypothetical protein
MKNNQQKAIKSVLVIFISIVALPFFAFGTLLLVVPISRPNEAVRNYVFKQISTGTSWDDAIESINDKGWEVKITDTEHGLRINDAAGNAYFATDDEITNDEGGSSNIRIFGVKSMFVELGEFYGPFHTAVFAYLAFDENDKLVEVSIRRDIDAP